MGACAIGRLETCGHLEEAASWRKGQIPVPLCRRFGKTAVFASQPFSRVPGCGRGGRQGFTQSQRQIQATVSSVFTHSPWPNALQPHHTVRHQASPDAWLSWLGPPTHASP